MNKTKELLTLTTNSILTKKDIIKKINNLEILDLAERSNLTKKEYQNLLKDLMKEYKLNPRLLN